MNILLDTHHHRDPFDRLLIIQSKIEDMALVSADPAFDAYDIKRVW
jgi:PIN domain nuclease of toxin-antitoxin system